MLLTSSLYTHTDGRTIHCQCQLNRPLKCLRHASVKTMNRNAMWETCGKKMYLYLHAWKTRMT